jgi:hypothetical protein
MTDPILTGWEVLTLCLLAGSAAAVFAWTMFQAGHTRREIDELRRPVRRYAEFEEAVRQKNKQTHYGNPSEN